MSYLGREAAKAPIVSADLPDNGVSLAKMTGGTDGNIISYDASGNPVAIATGSDGQVLTSTGAGSPPAFEAAAAGGSTSASDLDSGTLAVARMASGTVLKVNHHLQVHTSAVYYTSGENTVATYTMPAPQTGTNNLLIQTIVTFQTYGNETSTSPSTNVIVKHNGTEIARAYGLQVGGGANTISVFRTNTINTLIAVDHASASGSRDIIIQLNPTAGRVGIQGDSDAELRNWGPIITVWELA